MKISVLVQPPTMMRRRARPCATRRAGIAADQRVRRTGRQAEVPGDQVPDDGADQPARITAEVTTLMSIMPEPIVFATAVPKTNAATKLKNAAQMTAWPGDRTRVETTVAMELAASWKPLM